MIYIDYNIINYNISDRRQFTDVHISQGSVMTCLRRGGGKGSRTRLPSVKFRSWFRFLAVSLQATWVINPAVGCHYFPRGPQLPSQPSRGLLPFSLLGEQKHGECEQFAWDCYRQRRGCYLNPGPFAPESSMFVADLSLSLPAKEFW